MNFAIDIKKIGHVLLADGWHAVVLGSFEIAPFELFDGPDEEVFASGFDRAIASTSFAFTEPSAPTVRVYGPLTSVLAVKATP